VDDQVLVAKWDRPPDGAEELEALADGEAVPVAVAVDRSPSTYSIRK